MATQDSSLIHREMARRAYDIHRINNPTDEDFKIIWDGYITDIVPAHSTADVETYKMDKYLREMSAKILIQRQDQAVKEENERRRSRGEKEMDKFQGGDQPIIESKFAIEKGLGSPQALSELYKELYVGLVKEYGVEKVQKQAVESNPTTHEQIMDQILASRRSVVDSKPPILGNTTNTTSISPLEELRQPQLIKIAKEKGIETHRTDKKAELIAKISQ